MTDSQEQERVEGQYVEDVAADINDGSLLIDVASGRASMSTRMWNDMVEEIAESRLRARQREGEREPDWPTVMDYITDLQAAVVQLQREVGMLADDPPADTEQENDNA